MEVDWTELEQANENLDAVSLENNAIGLIHDHPEGFCPTCQRRIPKKQEKTEEKKIRKTWSVCVPVSEQENGAEVLATLIEEARKELFSLGLPFGDEDKAKYFVLCAALGLFVTHAHSLMADG